MLTQDEMWNMTQDDPGSPSHSVKNDPEVWKVYVHSSVTFFLITEKKIQTCIIIFLINVIKCMLYNNIVYIKILYISRFYVL